MVTLIVVDSNIWIFAAREAAPEHELALKKIEELLLKSKVATNSVVVSEVFHKLFVLHSAAQAKRKVDAILDHPLISWMTLTRGTASRAISLAEREGLRINDALIAQQALENKAAILTDDVGDFRKVKGLKVMGLR